MHSLLVHDRRRFLKGSVLVSLAPFLPAFLTRSLAAVDAKRDDRVLVVIQLDGGNDGLNTVIPFADEHYAKNRRELRIKPTEVLKLNDIVGLNPQMKSAADLFEAGRLAIVQGVGYPNPNRSHFESMSIWHHARLASDEHDSIGWLGRTCDTMISAGQTSASSTYVGSEAPPVAVRARRASAISLESEADLRLAQAIGFNMQTSEPASDIAAFVQRSIADSYAVARQFSESNVAQASGSNSYPPTKLGQKLRMVSKLLKLGGGTRVYYASQPGYDTHSAQSYPHSQLLREFAGALKAFMTDLQAAKLDDRVVVLAFSEFGRRVAENASGGTDHGAAGPVILAGSAIRSGVLNQHPSLVDLDVGDLKMQVDFRQIYATLLQNWLGVDPQPILKERFEPFDLLKV